ncbi:TPA: cag pathogenicity island Cag12 family protein [Escherichia coli]
MMKKLVFLLISILAGCSSPPEPTPVQFEKANEVINPSLPYVPDFHGVIKSDVSGKGWVYEITSLSGVQARTPTFYYALAHADRIVVTTHDAGLWFRIGLCQSVFQLKKLMSLKFIQSYSERR